MILEYYLNENKFKDILIDIMNSSKEHNDIDLILNKLEKGDEEMNNILDQYLENELIQECCFFLEEEILDENDIEYMLDEKNIAVEFLKLSYNNRVAQKMSFNSTANVLKKKIKKAKTRKELDDVIRLIDKNISGCKRYRKARTTKGNIIPFLDKKLKEKNYDKFLYKMEELKQQAKEKKKTLNK